MSNTPETRDHEQEAALRMDAQKYYDIALALTNPDASQSLQHIIANLNFPLGVHKDSPELTAKQYGDLQKIVNTLKKYVGLLEEFPEFAAQEKTTGDGAFPDIYLRFDQVENTVNEYERRLRQVKE